MGKQRDEIGSMVVLTLYYYRGLNKEPRFWRGSLTELQDGVNTPGYKARVSAGRPACAEHLIELTS